MKELQSIIHNYENKLNRLPGTSIELARYERKKESLEQLYRLVDKRYQESALNELSQPGNVLIVGKGRIPDKPAKPNRIFIVIVGLIGGLMGAFGFILVKDYFNDKIQSPADIQNENIDVLAWIPQLDNIGKKNAEPMNLVISEKYRFSGK